MTRLVEGWADDVPHGAPTDFHRAVAARPDEAVLFSWMEFPAKAARDDGMARMAADPRKSAMAADMPFDVRLIYGGVVPIHDR